MKTKAIRVLRAKVIVQAGSADTVILKINAPSPVPALTNDLLSVKFLAAEGTGVDYVKTVFGIDPTVKD